MDVWCTKRLLGRGVAREGMGTVGEEEGIFGTEAEPFSGDWGRRPAEG